MRVTVGAWNLKDGGCDDGDDARRRRQLDLMASRDDVDLWALQEAKGWSTNGNRLLHQAADRLGMSARFLISSNHHDCDLAMLVRERPGLCVVAERHDNAAPWWHALGHLELNVAGIELHFLNVHLAPSSPGIRLAEAETFGLFRKRRVIAAGDFNAWPATDPLPSPDEVPELDKIHRKLDQLAAKAIAAAGFCDVAAHQGNTTPTVGHTKPNDLAYRCDRIETTLPPDTYQDFEVLPIHQPSHTHPGAPVLSDHRPVIATFTIDPTVLGTTS